MLLTVGYKIKCKYNKKLITLYADGKLEVHFRRVRVFQLNISVYLFSLVGSLF